MHHNNELTEFQSIMKLIEERYNLDKAQNDLIIKYKNEGKKHAEIIETEGFKELDEKRFAFKKNYVLTPEEMRIIISEKKSKNVSGRQLNCEVFDKMDTPEFRSYLYELTNNQNLIGQRFQIVIQSSEPRGFDYHWSAADIIVRENEVEILHFDSIVSPDKVKGGVNGSELEEILRSINSPKPVKLIDSHTEGKEDLDVSMQRDYESCSILALSSALTMSKISDLHTLPENQLKLQTDRPGEKNITRYSISAVNLPSRLMKNAQDARVIEHYQKTHNEDDLNKIPTRGGHKSIEEYTASRSHMIPSTSQSEAKRKQNLGVLYTREHYKKIVKTKISQSNKAFFDSSTDKNQTNEPIKEEKNKDNKSKNLNPGKK